MILLRGPTAKISKKTQEIVARPTDSVLFLVNPRKHGKHVQQVSHSITN